jgi:uncharacterized protein YifE (UPF0438 family)
MKEQRVMKTTRRNAIPPDHQRFLDQRPFHFGCSTHIFPADELDALIERGNWMEALASAVIQPATPEHDHFLLVDREQVEPVTVDERAWVRLKGRREFECEEAKAVPPPEPEDYGIIEWEKEKCWW